MPLRPHPDGALVEAILRAMPSDTSDFWADADLGTVLRDVMRIAHK